MCGLDFIVADAPAAIKQVLPYISLREPQIIDVSEKSFICAMHALVDFNVAVNYLDLSSMRPILGIGLGGFRIDRVEPDPDGPAVLSAREYFRIVVTGEWDPSDPEKAELLEVRIADPRPVPLYYDEES